MLLQAERLAYKGVAMQGCTKDLVGTQADNMSLNSGLSLTATSTAQQVATQLKALLSGQLLQQCQAVQVGAPHKLAFPCSLEPL